MTRANLSGAALVRRWRALAIVASTTCSGLQRDAGEAWRMRWRPASTRIIVIVALNADIAHGLPRRRPHCPLCNRLARELDFVSLRTRRTVGAPLAPVVPTSPPAGFRWAGVTRTEPFAISRFLAVGGTVTVAALRHLKGEPSAEVILQR